ncbi:capsule polysaccharide biosynthesis domain protein [Leptospira fainei serovar Hurstbridge str. BUT 6]|uniref:Capsule polysaccharide biosynthesis domain protein n=1 Tax=Leptospira fainei serovar Hurstbridge str. BUT 6 TaxID=1193011 RepID=S3V5W4_9LEPT|nr:capsule polysaccharide biosynthesis domain protein [Leptospira fainei]EPG76014.1 capsule polysaccharide biosynthesis domain protein [Leptospira fainei serovar Hurstbridge str. BUT 6]
MKILFFAPHSAIWVHSFPEALIAESLQKLGNEIVYITCDSLYNEYCTVMSSLGMDQESSLDSKSSACDSCYARRKLLYTRFKFREIEIGKKITAEEKDFVTALSKSDFPELLDYTRDGIPVGRISLYELLLQTKKGNLSFSPEEKGFYRIAFRNALHTHIAAERILLEEQPDILFVYNSLYVVNHSFAKVAKEKGIPFYFLHAGENISDRLSRMIIYNGYTFEYRKELVKYWPHYRDKPIGPEAVSNVGNHFFELLRGNHFLVYSSNLKESVSIRKTFDIPEGRKIVSATMSSNDERFASACVGVTIKDANRIFANQAEWIRATIEYFKVRRDHYLIIRVHPREFPNRRDSVKSEHAGELEKLLQDLPENVKINWPEDNISLYDLAKETDAFLNAWSSVGEEMTLLGIPVLLYSPDLILYPADLNITCVDKEDYFEQLDEALKQGWNGERIIKAFRWYEMKFTAGTFKVSNFFHYRESASYAFSKLPLWKSKLQTAWLLFASKFSSHLKSLLLLKRSFPMEFFDLSYEPNMVESSPLELMLAKSFKSKLELSLTEKTISAAQEKKNIKREMKRIFEVLFSDELKSKSGSNKNLYRNMGSWLSK